MRHVDGGGVVPFGIHLPLPIMFACDLHSNGFWGLTSVQLHSVRARNAESRARPSAHYESGWAAIGLPAGVNAVKWPYPHHNKTPNRNLYLSTFPVFYFRSLEIPPPWCQVKFVEESYHHTEPAFFWSLHTTTHFHSSIESSVLETWIDFYSRPRSREKAHHGDRRVRIVPHLPSPWLIRPTRAKN